MPSKQSAGILLFRRREELEFFLVHPGGPFWAKRDEGAWSVPKGEFEDEDPLQAARREFQEETGQAIDGQFIPLTPVTQKSGKVVHAWAVEGDIDPEVIQSNQIEIEWPPRSGKRMSIPEVDRGAWFTLDVARLKINPAQQALLDELAGMAAFL